MKAWGVLPEDVRQRLKLREWDHSQHLRQRLLGGRAFPFQINLCPPTGKQALDNMERFHAFIASWRDWPNQAQLQWKQRRYLQLGEYRVPSTLTIGSIQELIESLGEGAKRRAKQWQQLMAPILGVNQKFYAVLVKQLYKLETLSCHDASLIALLLPQLKQGMGHQCYLRALPIIGVDTKFLETHQSLISALLDEVHGGEIVRSGGLVVWLGCIDMPKDWLWVRPLCAETRKALGGVSIMKIPTETLIANPLPGECILVVENEQSGYALPELENTVAVFGGGRNLAWMDADWLRHKKIIYWGDLDSWGFVLLADARKRQPHLVSMLMDRETVLLHRDRMVEEPEPYFGLPDELSEAEQQLYLELRDGVYGNTRLEQERISADHICSWLSGWFLKKTIHDESGPLR